MNSKKATLLPSLCLSASLQGSFPFIRKTGASSNGDFLAGKEPLEPCGNAVKVPETFAGAARFLRETLHDLGVFFNGTGKGALIADRLVLAADFWKEKAMGGDEALRLREAADHFGTDDAVYLEKDLEEGRTAALLWQCLAKVCSKSHEEESRFQGELPRVKK